MNTTWPNNFGYKDDAGEMKPDNLFVMESGTSGADIIITFTQSMSKAGPVIQHD